MCLVNSDSTIHLPWSIYHLQLGWRLLSLWHFASQMKGLFFVVYHSPFVLMLQGNFS